MLVCVELWIMYGSFKSCSQPNLFREGLVGPAALWMNTLMGPYYYTLQNAILHECIHYNYHWNGSVIILMKFSSLAALEVVKMTTSSAASDENFIKMTFSFHFSVSRHLHLQ